jgi:hypothetical protein
MQCIEGCSPWAAASFCCINVTVRLFCNMAFSHRCCIWVPQYPVDGRVSVTVHTFICSCCHQGHPESDDDG